MDMSVKLIHSSTISSDSALVRFVQSKQALYPILAKCHFVSSETRHIHPNETSMRFFLRQLLFIGSLFALNLNSVLQAQAILETKPLSFTSTCRGSTLSIPFRIPFGSYTTNTVFTVQVSDGGEFTDIPTGKTLMADGTTVDERKISATIPLALTSGVPYAVRIKSSNPDYVGTPSITKLVINGKESRPPEPRVDSLNVECMSTNQSSMSGIYADIRFKLVAGATPRLYYDSTKSSFSEYAEFPYQTKLPTGEYVRDLQSGYFQINKTGATSPTYVYPVRENTYYVSQIIDGCESELVASKLRIIWKAGGGPGVRNPRPGNYRYGTINYCQGDQSYPLDVNGHYPPPENFQVYYGLGGSSSTLTIPIPDTRIIGRKDYELRLVPIDPRKGCPSDNPLTFDYLTVYVYPVPTKPVVTTNVTQYYQGQPSQPLSASVTDSTATLVWYGTSATGGTGSTTAPLPPTNQSGELTYYVAQKIGTCEGERTAITVRINPLLGLDDPGLANAVEIFPNPVYSSFTVRIHGLTGHSSAQIELQDLTGQSLLRRDTQQETTLLTLDQYPAGSYLLLISVGNRRASRRIVKL